MAILAQAALLALPETADAVLPPHIYAQRCEASRIKGIATITDVQTQASSADTLFNTVTFAMEYSIGDDSPETFTGTCKSMAPGALPMMGGTIYYYPRKDQRVFVTVSQDDGYITSLTDMTPDLERVVRNRPDMLRYRMGKVTHDGPKAQLRGKEPGPQADPMDQLDELGSAQAAQGLLHSLNRNDLGDAKYQLRQDADPNHRYSSKGLTPLMLARSMPMAQLLLRAGADPRLTDAKGNTVLHYAVTKADAEGLLLMFAMQGISPGKANDDGEPPLFSLLGFVHDKKGLEPTNQPFHPDPGSVIRMLLSMGGDIDARDTLGQTALMKAAVWNDGEMVKMLLGFGADKTIKNNHGTTAKDMAYELGHRHIYQLLD